MKNRVVVWGRCEKRCGEVQGEVWGETCHMGVGGKVKKDVGKYRRASGEVWRSVEKGVGKCVKV